MEITNAWAIVWSSKTDNDYELFCGDDENLEPLIYLTEEKAYDVFGYMSLKPGMYYKIIQITIIV